MAGAFLYPCKISRCGPAYIAMRKKIRMRTVAFTSELRANFEMCLVHGTFIYQCAVLQEIPADKCLMTVL